MPETQKRHTGGDLALLGALVVAGIPLFAYLWETLNELLEGHVEVARVGVSVLLLSVFLGLLTLLARGLTRLAAPARAPADEPVVSGTLFLTALLVMFVFGVWLILYQTLLIR